MNKKIKLTLMSLIIIFLVIATSYLIFSFGITDKIQGSLLMLSSVNNKNHSQGDLPVINYVINSSGEKMVNNDVVLTVNATSIYNIKKIEYTYDFKNWIVVNDNLNSRKINYKIIFKEDIDKTIYIRVQNIKGYRSYGYKTVVKIDKEKPKLTIKQLDGKLVIKATDNVGLSAIQYSNDGVNWDDENVSGKEVTLLKENIEYKYIRPVDLLGNIGLIKEVK